MNQNCKIVYMGTPEFAVAPLRQLIDKGYHITAVVTAPDKPVGRGLRIAQSDVKKYALENGLRILQPTSLKDSSFIQELSNMNADLFVVVAFRMLPKEVWSLPKKGTFNLHASLLPMYRGAAPINWAIINGEQKTGVTTFLIDQEIDTGKILFSEEVKIEPEDNAGTLHDKLMEKGALLVEKTVRELIKGNVTPMDQKGYHPLEITLKNAPKINRETCTIDWSQPCGKIHNLIRGMSPYPAASATLSNGIKDVPVKIFRSKELPGQKNLEPGAIETDGKNYLRVGCGEGSLDIESLQAAGKKRMTTKEFLAGLREAKTYRFILT